MRNLAVLLRIVLIAIFVAGIGLPGQGLAADAPSTAEPVMTLAAQDCARHAAGAPAAADLHRSASGCLVHCLASALTPEPVQPPLRSERVSRLTAPAPRPLSALVAPAPEAPPPRA
ncbi:hypothetical protein [Rhodobacter lacus]|uniref:Uncharacterized protein n=1 Tax=Rhodobacter lacus TaxID=1641972 RepID=A0ABW5AAD4_9RHOB